MPSFSLKELEHYIGFDEQDAANLHALAPYVRPMLPGTIDRFYDEIQKHAGARVLMSGGTPQAVRLRGTLARWLEQLFRGTYDDDYWKSRERIGEVHVRIGLPQQYMFAAMQVIWAELERGIRGLGLPNISAKLSSLHKLLTLELAVMLDSYKEHYSQQIRGVERDAVQERLTEAEHLAQIGHLAASLAHEIKNPLAGISGAIQVIRDSMKSSDPHRPILDEILRQIGRLDNTVKDLLIYARPKPPRFRKCAIQDVIAGALPVWRQQPEIQRVNFEYVNSRALPVIAADENQIRTTFDEPPAECGPGVQAGRAGTPDRGSAAGRHPPLDRGSRTRHGPAGLQASGGAVFHDQGPRHGAGTVNLQENRRDSWGRPDDQERGR
jgi:hypothetical protein